MNSPADSSSPASDLALVTLLDELAERIRAGEKPNWDDIRAQHPNQFSEIQRLLPVAEAMAALGDAEKREDAGSHRETPAEAIHPHRLGDFQLLREIGRGGMGIVYEARQISLGRRTALKVLPLASVLDPRQLQRFQNEARAAATLSHPHIVPVYSVGCEGGVHYIAMQLIEGRSLSDIIASLRDQAPASSSTSLSPVSLSGSHASSITQTLAGLSTNSLHDQRGYARSVAQLGIQVAEALEHAHRVGVVHRDIKPSNLLVDNQGQVWVADFGLAMLPGDAQLTMTGDLVGTLRYMSPEQVRGERGATDFRTDVYSLGVTLYELLTLQPAFPATDRQALLRQVANDDPPRPRRVRRGIPVDLETIIRKAIHREPAQRYASAQALADDLRRYLEQRPIKARPPSVTDSLAKWVRRRPALAALALVTMLATAVLLLGQWRYSSWLQEALQTAEAREQDLRRQVYPSDIRDAFTAITIDDTDSALAILNRYLPSPDRPDDEDLRGQEWHYLRNQVVPVEPLREFIGHEQAAVHSLALSPDEKLLATGDMTGRIIVWKVATGEQVHSFAAHSGEIRGLAFSPDGTKLYSTGMGKYFRGWEVGTWKQLFSRYAHDGTATSLVINRAGDRIATSGRDGRIRLWNPEVEAPIWTVKVKNTVYDLEFAEDDQLLVSVHKGYEVRFLNVATGAERKLSQPGTSDMNLQEAQTLPGGKQVVVAGNRSLLSILDTKSGDVVQHLEFSHRLPYAMTLSPGGRWFVCAGHRGAIDIWDAASGLHDRYAYTSFFGHTNHVTQVLITRDEKHLLSCGDDGRVRLWDLANLPRPIRQMVMSPLGNVTELERSPNGKMIGALAGDGRVLLFDARSFTILHTLGEPGFKARHFVFSADNSEIAAVDTQGRIKIWKTRDGKLVQQLQSPPQGAENVCEGLAFSLSGKEIFVAGTSQGDRGFLLRNYRDGQPAQPVLDIVAHDIEQLAQTPDFKQLIVGSFNSLLPIVDPESGAVEMLPKSIRQTNRFTFSANGHYMAAGNYNDQFILMYDLSTKRIKKTFPLPAPNVVVRGLAFSPRGRRFAVSSSDGYVRLYDAGLMRELMTFSSLLWTPHAICFSADGKQLIAAVSPLDPLDPSGLVIWELEPTPP